MLNSSPSKYASVEQSGTKSIPFLLPGELTPAIIRDWAEACELFCTNQKDLKPEDYVKKVAWGMRDLDMRDWYRTEKAKINAYTLPEYIEAMKARYLRPDWDEEARDALALSTQGLLPFAKWQTSFRADNILLRDTPFYFEEADVRKHLNTHMHSDLKALCKREKANKIVKFDEWLEKVRVLDEHRLEDERRLLRLLGKSKSVTTRPTSTSTQTASSGPSSTRTTDKKKVLPKLTDDERNLLDKYNGCRKCRRFNVSHMSSNCPNDFPNAETYKMLTEADALRSRGATSSKLSRTITTAAVIEESPAEVVAAVVMPSAVLDESDEDTDDD
ncbi:hypothetical protein NEOLEDRAFT_1152861 [Neolentinus lepideus HHB14362 ss-1]|uniref:Retrotransposon gag domain-containing protein n=1 Tax=Neolentinus lepideus HHB14362 ss-1 TaxID=1314782 RepID=A0A165M564_9AGAM|nr:hypothetical protein NEOLEDRAFT_1152861 [Neolentinus lepideus HHB14362 ss-1]